MAMEMSITEISEAPKPRKPRGRPIGKRKAKAKPKRDNAAESARRAASSARRAELAAAGGAWRLRAVECPACGHIGMVSNSLEPTREVKCSRCGMAAVFCVVWR
jgi:ribosomal protein S27E